MTALKSVPEAITIIWDGGVESIFHAIWLRDNCRCEKCGEATIGRRHLRLSEIDLGIEIENARLETIAGEETLHIQWSDGHQGTFAFPWLHRHAYDRKSRINRAYTPDLWNDTFRTTPPEFSYSSVMQSELEFLAMLKNVHQHGLCFVSDAPSQPNTVENLASKVGVLQESNFGRVFDLIADKRHRSIATDADPLKPHTDEPYRASPPGILMFHCIETDVQGEGASIFLDGFEIAETLRTEDPEGFQALTHFNHGFRRFFDGDVDLIAEFPIISVDEFGHLTGIRINDRVAAPPSIDTDAIPRYYRALQRLLQLSEDPNRWIQRVLKPGDMAIFDNHRILHGRTQLRFHGRRWLQWAQVERGDFYSTLRILSDQLGQHRNDHPFLRGAYGS